VLVTERTYSGTLERLARVAPWTVDLETTGLETWHGDRLCGVAVEAGGVAAYFPFRHGEGPNLHWARLGPLLDVLTDGRTLIGHNLIRFDCQMLANEDHDGVQRLVLDDSIEKIDTMIDALLYNENEPTFRLKALADKYVDPGSSGADKRLDAILKARGLKKGEMWRLPASDVADYACADVRYATLLHDFYTVRLARDGLTSLAKEMCRYARLLSRMERAGLAIDEERCARYILETTQRQENLLLELRTRTGNPKFNPNSPKQVCSWLGIPSSKAAVLDTLDNPDCDLLLKYRSCSKVIGTYYDPILALCDPDGILHPQLNLTRDPTDRGGTRSCRLSCSKPNFQALPRPNEIYRVRDLVLPQDGREFLAFDYERAEMWMGGSYCGEPAIFEAYHAGRDIYSEMAAGLQITRHQAKILFLMIQYGAGIWKIAEVFGWSEEKARAVRSDFYRLYPLIPRTMYDLADRVEHSGRLTLFTGRIIHFDNNKTKYYAGWNRLIQGSVGEMVRLAMQRLEPVLDHYGAEMKLQVHDEVLIETPPEHLQVVRREAQAILEGFDDWPLRPRVEPKTGPTYGSLTKLTTEELLDAA
jgi:DNA polymerase I